MEMAFKRVNVADIEEDYVNNPRLEFDDAALDDLANSIDKQGLLQPILVRAKRDENGLSLPGKYIIISGARRYKAIRYKLGLHEIDVGVTTSLDDEAQRFVAQVQENEQREALNGEELRAAVLRMHLTYKMSNAVIANSLGKRSSNFVSRILASARPGMEKFSEMCGRSTEVLAEIKKFDLPDRERLLAFYEEKKVPFTGGKLRKIGLLRSAGINIDDMDIAAVLKMTADEVRTVARTSLDKAQTSRLFKEGAFAKTESRSKPKGKYADDSEEDDLLFSHQVLSLLDGPIPKAGPQFAQVPTSPSVPNDVSARSSWSNSDGIMDRRYANDDGNDDSIGGIPTAVDLLDQALELKINVRVSRLQDVVRVLKDNFSPDHMIELPFSIKTSRARELIDSLGGDPSLDIDRLVHELTRRLAHV